MHRPSFSHSHTHEQYLSPSLPRASRSHHFLFSHDQNACTNKLLYNIYFFLPLTLSICAAGGQDSEARLFKQFLMTIGVREFDGGEERDGGTATMPKTTGFAALRAFETFNVRHIEAHFFLSEFVLKGNYSGRVFAWYEKMGNKKRFASLG